MQPFVAFRLLGEPRSVTQEFVPFQMDSNKIILKYLIMHKKY